MMNSQEQFPLRFETLSETMRAFGFPPPQHPLIALINGIDQPLKGQMPLHQHVLGFYKISFRPFNGGALKYGQTRFDFNEGGLLFAAPNQIIGGSNEEMAVDSGCINRQISLLIHPDFLWHYPLVKKIRQYSYFSYSVKEALFLSENEKEVLLALFRTIEDELSNRLDEMSHDVIIAQVELLLTYAQRFYKRQFITRKDLNHELLEQMELVLEGYFNSDKPLHQGIPSVKFLADLFHVSPGYLSDMLRSLTGRGAQQHIHDKLIEKAMEKLSTTNLSVSEIAYELGFEHAQSFNKLFKSKTKKSPLVFRSAFN